MRKKQVTARKNMTGYADEYYEEIEDLFEEYRDCGRQFLNDLNEFLGEFNSIYFRASRSPNVSDDELAGIGDEIQSYKDRIDAMITRVYR